jgi:putative redox protein
MVEITARYEGNLRCSLKHGPSGATLITDAPRDNQGEGAAFSPTDLVAAALPACMMTIMGIVAKRHGLDLGGMTAVATKEMVTAPIRRIGRVVTRIRVPLPASHPQREMLENAAHTCPVHRSLLAEIDAPIEFEWTG